MVRQLSSENLKQMMQHRVALRKIFCTLNVPGQLGSPIRGHGCDEKSTFIQFLKRRSEDVKELQLWLNRTGHKWLHHDIQNEILQLMADQVQSKYLEILRRANYYSIMID